MAEAIFWVSFAFVFYTFAGYPLLLMVWRRLARKPVKRGFWQPSVSIVIAAHNEAMHIETKIRNCLELDYPCHKLEIILSLDGSTDGTEEIARQFESAMVRVIPSLVHEGKAAALNRGVAAANNKVVVFCDARQRIHPHALRQLITNFSDSTVGAVSGELILVETESSDDDTSAPMGLYWRYEKWMRGMESDIHSTAGATGALYAIRRELFRPLPEDTILDDVLVPMRIVMERKRVIFDPRALAYDKVACCAEIEFRRKVRTLSGNYQLLVQAPELLLPWRNPIFVQFVSHKLARLLTPYFLGALFVSNCFLLRGFYLIPFALQFAWYALALAGWLAPERQQGQLASRTAMVGKSREFS
ncbi:MAG: glycosyltransferase family 2 protein [Acidobacteria bacterium]|nr:glycosyltransferase family 2 protein [Acidobacteriota bacterium]